jgi:PKD repeat protein
MDLEDYITVGTPPAAGFEASTTQIFAGETVDFTNTTQGDDVTYEWYFDGGTPDTSSATNPVDILYAGTGIFDVQLVATNPFGTDTLLMEDYIDVLPVGLEDISRERFNVYPNPAKDKITLRFETEDSYKIQLNTLQGKTMDQRIVNGNSVTLNLDQIERGVYILSIWNLETNSRSLKKIILMD